MPFEDGPCLRCAPFYDAVLYAGHRVQSGREQWLQESCRRYYPHYPEEYYDMCRQYHYRVYQDADEREIAEQV